MEKILKIYLWLWCWRFLIFFNFEKTKIWKYNFPCLFIWEWAKHIQTWNCLMDDFQLTKCKVVLHNWALTESSSLELPMVGGIRFCKNVLHNEGWSWGILWECTMENAGTSKQLEAILMEHAGLSKCLLNVQEHQNTIIPLQNSCGRSVRNVKMPSGTWGTNRGNMGSPVSNIFGQHSSSPQNCWPTFCYTNKVLKRSNCESNNLPQYFLFCAPYFMKTISSLVLWGFFKVPEPEVLWFWNTSKNQNQRFFNLQISEKRKRKRKQRLLEKIK